MLPDLPQLRTVVVGDLVLRPYSGADTPSLLRVFTDPDTIRWNPGPTDPDEIVGWWTARNDWSSGTHVSWAVADLDDELLGSVSLHHLDQNQRNCEVGYLTAPWARSRGVATGALRIAATIAFTDLGLHRVQVFHDVRNTASCTVATRAGFQHEGTLRQSYRPRIGPFNDEHLHARLAADPPP